MIEKLYERVTIAGKAGTKLSSCVCKGGFHRKKIEPNQIVKYNRSI